jgi:hypothetical protein
MNRFNASLLSAAVSGLMLGAAGCGSTKDNQPSGSSTAQPAGDKHVCAKQNACAGKGGCATGDKGCAAKNSCKGKGGCAATAAKHACAGKNACNGMGGCGSGDKGCAGKNTCSGKGGCAVPVQKK